MTLRVESLSMIAVAINAEWAGDRDGVAHFLEQRRAIYRLYDGGLYVIGFEGSGVTTNASGVEELSSARRIPAAGWLVVGGLPTGIAFGPIIRMRSHIYVGTALLSLFAASLAWLFIRRELAPIERAAAKMRAMTDTGHLVFLRSLIEATDSALAS